MAIQALRRRYWEKPDLSDLDVWVVSPGGVGTTFLMEYLSKYVRLNHPYDDDGLKHWPAPPAELSNNRIKVIFVTGKIDNIVDSIDRRDWLATQSVNLGSVIGAISHRQRRRRAFRKAVQRQFQTWSRLSSDEILTLVYDDIWDSIPQIAEFLDLDVATFVDGFPKRKPRLTASAVDASDTTQVQE